MFWIIVLVLVGCFVFGIIALVLGGALCFADLRVEILGGLRNGGESVGGGRVYGIRCGVSLCFRFLWVRIVVRWWM